MIVFAGDGECAFRAIVVGAIMAIQQHANWNLAHKNFVRRVQRLFGDVRPKLIQQQGVRADGASASQGMQVLQVHTKLKIGHSLQSHQLLWQLPLCCLSVPSVGKPIPPSCYQGQDVDRNILIRLSRISTPAFEWDPDEGGNAATCSHCMHLIPGPQVPQYHHHCNSIHLHPDMLQ